MKILLLGATGRLGSRLLRYAHEAGHRLSVLVRQPEKLPPGIPLRVVEGDIFDGAPLSEACQGQDLVCSALGSTTFSADPEFLTTAAWAVHEAMEQAQLKRILWVAGEAILDTPEGQMRKDAPTFPPVLKNIALDHYGVYSYFQGSDLDWTLICPPPMSERVRTGHYRVAANTQPENGHHIAYEDVADFMLREIQAQNYSRQRVGLAY